MSASSPADHSLVLSMSAEESLALRHFLVWLDGVAADGGVITPEAFAAQFTAAELEILAGLRRAFLEFEFPLSPGRS